jgi:transcriptional regulator GlxA family with amidase domain
MTETPTHAPPTTEVVLFDGFDDLDAVAPLEILRAAGFPVRAVGFPPGSRTITSAHGLRIEVDGDLSDAPQLVLIPGGGWRDGDVPGVRVETQGELPAVVAGLHAQGTMLASVCTGAMVIATAGLLRGRPAITHRIALDDLEETGADVLRDARVVDDGDIMTAGGVTAGIDMSLWLVERYCGRDAARYAAARIEHEPFGQVVVTERAGAGT